MPPTTKTIILNYLKKKKVVIISGNNHHTTSPIITIIILILAMTWPAIVGIPKRHRKKSYLNTWNFSLFFFFTLLQQQQQQISLLFISFLLFVHQLLYYYSIGVIFFENHRNKIERNGICNFCRLSTWQWHSSSIYKKSFPINKL